MCKVDVVVDVSRGDCGKGKVVNYLLGKTNNNYSYVCRFNGGGNAGHQIYFQGNKLTTHHLPAGILHNITSIIGAGCVIHPETLFQEIKEFEDKGFNVRDNLLISYNAHIITDKHIQEDNANEDTKNGVGSTRRGIAPAYRDKYARVGKRAKDIPELQKYLCDPIDIWYGSCVRDIRKRVLVEGAQGFYLCPDWGDYPFCTSSPPTATYALHSLGLSPHFLERVYSVCKTYETYVGSKNFQPEGKVFEDLQRVGKEFGATTGRKRQTNWLNITELQRALLVNGATDLILNKLDVLRELDVWKIRGEEGGHEVEYDLKNEKAFKDFIISRVPLLPIQVVLRDRKQRVKVRFSDNPYTIDEKENH